MAVFTYRSTTTDGTVMEGVIEAADEKTAVERLKNTGLIPLSIRAPTERGLLSKLRGRIPRGELTAFTSELSTLLMAGLPLDRSLNILAGITEHRGMKEMVQSLLNSIREGGAFSDAVQKHPAMFPRIYVNMVRAGEAGGVLDIVLEKLNEFLETSKELKDHVYSAMIYPLFLVVTGGISLIVLLTFVLPRFSSIFSELGSSMPLSTQILLAFSDVATSYGWLFFVFLIAALLAGRNYIAGKNGRRHWDALKLLLMRDLIIKLETARFCRTLGTLLLSGVPLLQALTNAREVIGNQVVATSIEAVAKGAKEGQGISSPLSRAGVFPSLALSMIKVGEETGQLDQMLLQIATTYEKMLKQAVKRFMAILEPATIMIMGLLIGFIVISMLLAIFSIADLPI
jgi:general secretion pathway protein F